LDSTVQLVGESRQPSAVLDLALLVLLGSTSEFVRTVLQPALQIVECTSGSFLGLPQQLGQTAIPADQTVRAVEQCQMMCSLRGVARAVRQLAHLTGVSSYRLRPHLESCTPRSHLYSKFDRPDKSSPSGSSSLLRRRGDLHGSASSDVACLPGAWDGSDGEGSVLGSSPWCSSNAPICISSGPASALGSTSGNRSRYCATMLFAGASSPTISLVRFSTRLRSSAWAACRVELMTLVSSAGAAPRARSVRVMSVGTPL